MKDAAAIIYLVDDDERVLKALRRLLETSGHAVSCHASAEDFLERHDLAAPGCAVVDLGLPGLDGFGLQQALAETAGGRPLIFLTGRGNIPASVRAMKAGAVDFLTKPVDADALLAAVGLAIERDRQSRQERNRRNALDERLASLTPREREVLGHVVAGRLNKQIAADLGTSEKTIKVHRGRMMAKMGVRSVAELVRAVARPQP